MSRALRGLRQWLDDGRIPAGEKLPAEARLAEELAVSRFTVHGALERLAEEGRLQPFGKRGWTATGRAPSATPLFARSVAVMGARFDLSQLATLRSQAATVQVYAGLLGALDRAGLHGYTLQVERALDEGIAALIDGGLQGLVLMLEAAGHRRIAPFLRGFAHRRLPVVAHGDGLELPGVDRVVHDHRDGTRQLVHHLAARGCRRILRLWETHPGETRRPGWMTERDAGYETGCTETGLEPLPAHDLPMPSPSLGQDDRASFDIKARIAESHLRALLDGAEAPDALLVVSDRHGFAPARALRRLGIEPGRDLPLCGYDHCWQDCIEAGWEPWRPDLTVAQDPLGLGAALLAVLNERRERGPDAPIITRSHRPLLVAPAD